MIVIADSGSTKTDWALVYPKKTKLLKSEGINPFIQDEKQMHHSIVSTFKDFSETPDQIFFYGAGCKPEKTDILTNIFKMIFSRASVSVQSDLLGAALATCKNKPGFASILGTGANTCFFDGENITENIPPLGYILGDEGGGAHLGRKLITLYLRNDLPHHLRNRFEEKYQEEKDKILEYVYKQSFTNRYMAKYTHFLSENIKDPFIHDLVQEVFCDFFENTIMKYKAYKHYPLHFVGSVGFIFKDIIKEIMEDKKLKSGTFLKAPLEGLIDYHRNIIYGNV